ncbi:hypothetical protein ACFX13_020574 [Malus domestica]|uniref:uncharacterized protein n=1 Tax=Malus domestica TaxID=3750 RepID=UPI0010AB49CD|nr:pre-mRNA-splicing factor CWC22 homolog [Malus domestica]XP_050125808.1 uncharacterized protein LOC126603104 [Malus sylvestris]
MIHRLETNSLRNVAKFFAHLLSSDAHPCMYVRLTEEDTTSSSRIFLKFLFQELSQQQLNDPAMEMQGCYDSIFPKDNPKNTRFAINFFASIGLSDEDEHESASSESDESESDRNKRHNKHKRMLQSERRERHEQHKRSSGSERHKKHKRRKTQAAQA